MLSIGKLGAGHSAYYELSVATGAEDYYTGHGEARGRYLGTGSDALDLNGVVAQGDLKYLFRGTHPVTGEQWVQRREPDRKPRMIRKADGRVVEGAKPEPVAAFDLTFSAPKSVSVLWGLSPVIVQQDVREAHDYAVRAALDYLERAACVTRRGAGGARQLRGEGFVSAAFRHRVSRAVDPQLHTHVLVANATRAEGRYSSLYGRLLYREAKTAGFLYHAALRSELTKRLGVEWARDSASPHPEIVGVDRSLRELFSKRSQEIATQLEASGQSGARAANAATIDTRAAKTYLTESVDLHERWSGEARAIDAPDVLRAVGRVPARALILTDTTPTIDAAARSAFAPDGLTARRTTFHRRDIIQLACEYTPTGATISQIERLADAILDYGHRRGMIVQLDNPSAESAMSDPVRADGERLKDGRGDAAFTTRELLDAELSIITSAHERTAAQVAQVESRQVQRTIGGRGAGRALAKEQRRMVEQITTSGAGIEAVVGLAGAGKTYSLAAAHDVWRDAGVPVRGTATALTAAKTLEADTAIRAETVAMLKAWHEHGVESGDHSRIDDAIPRGGVLIVDEAGMTETRDLAWLAQQAAERDTKLVLVGDHRQLPEIGAGGAFEHLVHNLADTSTLATNRRQHHEWERATLGELRDGSIEHAIAAYDAQGRIVTNSSPEALRQQLAADWLNAREDGRDVAMIAYTNADVVALNHAARTLLDERGKLGRERISVGGAEWAVGDEVIVTQNHRALGLTNGTRGHVTHANRHGLTITTTSGEQLRVPRDLLARGEVAHGYATTGHKTQGMTVRGEAFVLATDHVNRQWLYVGMSRATDRSRIYTDTPTHDATGRVLTPEQQHDSALLDLVDLASRNATHTLASNHGSGIDPDVLDKNDLRRHLHRQQLMADRAVNDHTIRRDIQRDPPRYLLPIINSQPLDPARREAWLRDAIKLEHHRRSYHLTHADMTRERGDHVLGRDRGRERGMGRGR